MEGRAVNATTTGFDVPPPLPDIHRRCTRCLHPVPKRRKCERCYYDRHQARLAERARLRQATRRAEGA